jgi:hypothetical protein
VIDKNKWCQIHFDGQALSIGQLYDNDPGWFLYYQSGDPCEEKQNIAQLDSREQAEHLKEILTKIVMCAYEKGGLDMHSKITEVISQA